MTPDVKTEIISQAKDFSMFGLFFQADPIVKFVMILLIFLSIWCWAIIINKSLLFKRERKYQSEFEELFWSGVDLQNLYDDIKHNCNNSFAKIFVTGMSEFLKNYNLSNGRKIEGVTSRLQNVVHVTIGKEIEHYENNMIVLASIGSIAPFIGLFGTVWGIMNSFQSIALSNNTSLAVVAPGIAEALFATALGLLAAIPAVAAYNKYSADIEKINNKLDFFATEFCLILNRKIEKN